MASTQQLKVLSLDKNLGLCTQYKGTRRLLKNIYTVMNLCVNRIVYTLGNITALKIVNSLKCFRVDVKPLLDFTLILSRFLFHRIPVRVQHNHQYNSNVILSQSKSEHVIYNNSLMA